MGKSVVMKWITKQDGPRIEGHTIKSWIGVCQTYPQDCKYNVLICSSLVLGSLNFILLLVEVEILL